MGNNVNEEVMSVSCQTPSDQNKKAIILLVDDEKVVRMVTKRRLERMGHSILEAEDGREALEILRAEMVDLVISDWMMPGMDGLALCEAVKSDDDLRSTYIILMTALDQPAQIAEGLTRGADDFMTKSASEQEIGARVNAGLRTCQLIKELAYSNEVILRQQQALDAELQSAGEFVVSLLPAQGNPVPKVEVAWQYLPSSRLGGDLFQVTPWGNDYLGLMILDMSGHGIGPALRAVSLAMTFREEHMLQRHPSFDPGEIIQRLNDENPLTDQGEYFTIWVGRLHLPSGQLFYASAGHPGAILTRSGQSMQVLGAQSWPVGFGEGKLYQSQHITLTSGDRLHLYSDGIYEVLSPKGQMWGCEGLQQSCLQAHEESLEKALNRIMSQSKTWQNQETFGDDVALVGVEIR